MPAAAIEVNELKKTYREGWIRRREVQALRGVSFRVEPGEIFGLLGPNGAGKTTFIKILLGIIRRTAGSAHLLGQPAGARSSRRRVGYLPENLRIPRHHTAQTALAFYGQLSGVSLRDCRTRGEKLLADVGLAERAGDRIRGYSKGMLQRLGLAQALLHNPDLLVLDEPTDGLDPIARAQVRTLLSRLKSEGKTVFVNTHLLQEVELVCDRVAILDRGQLRFVGSVAEVTSTAASEAQLEVNGAEETVRNALRERQVLRLEEMGPGQFRVVLNVRDQDEIDDVVDALRRAEVSVVSLVRHRLSLEDAFLKLVEKENAPMSAELV